MKAFPKNVHISFSALQLGRRVLCCRGAHECFSHFEKGFHWD